jgi:hypothetical protein
MNRETGFRVFSIFSHVLISTFCISIVQGLKGLLQYLNDAFRLWTVIFFSAHTASVSKAVEGSYIDEFYS